VAAASTDGGAAANAAVTSRYSFDASGPDGHRQRYVGRRSPRHHPAPSFVSDGGMIAPCLRRSLARGIGFIPMTKHDLAVQQPKLLTQPLPSPILAISLYKLLLTL
jgi:hypothetical protein